MNYLVQKVNKPLHIAVEVPGSKSITNRALLIGAMADGLSEIQGILFSDDSRFFLKALQELGFEINISEENSSDTRHEWKDSKERSNDPGWQCRNSSPFSDCISCNE